MRSGRILAGLVLTAVAGIATSSQTSMPRNVNAETGAAGSEACSSCHSEIYQSYSKTVMAKASGAAADGMITGEFDDKTFRRALPGLPAG